jgi:hypothetical protein
MTIASCVETDEELERVEAGHICPEMALAELLRQETGREAQSRKR